MEKIVKAKLDLRGQKESLLGVILRTVIWGILLIRGLARPYGFLLISFILISFTVLSACQHKKEMDTTLFLGPPLGETILLEDGEGVVTRRTCTAISEEGVYSIEERTRFLTGNVTEENIAKNKLSEKVVRIIRGEEDLVNNYTLQAKDGKIILHNTTFDKTDIMLDFTSRKWVIYGRSTHGKIKMECRIVREKEDFIRGKKRKLIYVEMYSKLNNEPFVDAYTIASGLGIIYSESVSYGKTFVLYSLKDK